LERRIGFPVTPRVPNQPPFPIRQPERCFAHVRARKLA
jgi:hypothetical protein